jgi:hypothetical protein
VRESGGSVETSNRPVAGPVAGRRWRRAGLLALILLAAALVAGGTAYVLDVTRPLDDAAPAYTGGLQPVGDPVALTFGAGVDHAAGVSVVDGRAIAATRATDGAVWVSAINVGTGRLAWPPLSLGTWPALVGIEGVSQGVLVLTQGHEGFGSYNLVTVVDPTTGAKRWSVRDGTAYPFTEVVVQVDDAAHRLRGLDWSTGAVRWEVTVPDGGVVVAPRARSVTNAVDGLTAPAAPITLRDMMVVEVDGTLSTYDVGTGNRIDRVAGALPARGASAKVGDPYEYFQDGARVYGVGFDRIGGYNLSHGNGLTTLFTATPALVLAGFSGDCGPARICLETAGRRGGAVTISMVDVTSGAVVWQHATWSGGPVTRSGDRILASGSQLYRADGQLLLDFPPSAAAFVAPDRVLLLSAAGGGLTFPLSAADVDVYTVDPATGKQTRVGGFQHLRGACGADAHTLVCPTRDGLRAWRFAAG